MTTSRAAFDWIRELVEQSAGNVLDDSKTYLVESRLAPIVNSEGVPDVNALVHRLQSNRDPKLERQCVEALLIHESSFFRDPHYFDALAANILPELIEHRRAARRLTIWCAACATGQEPYSLAMLLHEHFPELLSHWKVEFIASDLSQTAIDQAKNGTYSQVEIDRGLSAKRTTRFFQRSGSHWQATAALRCLFRFRKLNLVNGRPPAMDIDLVLIRNVLIYMNEDTRCQVLSQVRESMSRHGHLVLGATETLFNLDVGFQRVDGKVPTYRKN